jgi:hypothetical protein
VASSDDLDNSMGLSAAERAYIRYIEREGLGRGGGGGSDDLEGEDSSEKEEEGGDSGAGGGRGGDDDSGVGGNASGEAPPA